MAPKRVRRTRSLVVSLIFSKVRWALATALACALVVSVHAQGVVGMEALDETLQSPHLKRAIGGPPLDLADLRGKWVLLHFWATWCGPCRRELPLLAALAGQRSLSDLQVVLVAVEGDTALAEIAAFAKDLDLSQPIYLAGASGLSADYWTWGIPVTYLIDTRGQLRGRWLGPRAWGTAAVRESLKALGD